MAATAKAGLVAGGNIKPNRFIKLSTSANNTALQAGANEAVIGIARQGTKLAPGIDTTGYLATSGDNVPYFGDGEVTMLVLGSGGCAAGDLLKSDINGAGVAIATSGTTAQEIGARALEAGASGELVRVVVEIQHKTYPALA